MYVLVFIFICHNKTSFKQKNFYAGSWLKIAESNIWHLKAQDEMLWSLLKTLWKSLEKLMLEIWSVFFTGGKGDKRWKALQLFTLIWFMLGIVYLKWLLDPRTIKPLQCSWRDIIADRIFLECWGIMCSLPAAESLLEQGAVPVPLDAALLCAGGWGGAAAAGAGRSVLQRQPDWTAAHGCLMAPVLTGAVCLVFPG